MIDWTDRPAAATYDLHGQSVPEALKNVEVFLCSQASARPGSVVRIVTGRGKSGGAAPIRTRTRSLLKRLKEQDRAVRDYVLEEGDGSFLVRLRS